MTQQLINYAAIMAQKELDERPVPASSEPPRPDWVTQETSYTEREDVPAADATVPFCSSACPWRRNLRLLQATDIVKGLPVRSWRAEDECSHPQMLDPRIPRNHEKLVCWPALEVTP